MGKDTMESQHAVSISPNDLVFDRKFDTALRMSHANSFLRRDRDNEPSTDDRFLLAAVSKGHKRVRPYEWVYHHHLFPEVFEAILNQGTSPRDDTRDVRTARIAAEVLECQLLWNFQTQYAKLRSSFQEYPAYCRNRWQQNRMMFMLLQGKHQLDALIHLLSKASRRKKKDEDESDWINSIASDCTWKSKTMRMTCCWSRGSVVIGLNNQLYFLPRSYLLLIHNKVCDVLSVLVYCSSCPDSLYGEDILAVVTRFVRCWMKLARRSQQKFFNISKLLEALCIGETLQELEGKGNKSFLETVVTGVEADGRLEYKGSELEEILHGASIPVRHEISCLSKIMGHPFCDLKKGAAQLHERVSEDKPIDLDCVIQCVRYAKEDFIRKFLLKEGRWPLVTFEPLCSKSLTRACLMGVDPRSPAHQKRYGKIALTDFDLVTIKRNMKFDWVENFLPYVKDRTVSLTRSETFKKYVDKDPTFKADWKQTRLLLFYLLWPETETNHMPYMRAYTAGEWDEVADYLVIRVVPKEKEHKIEARGFGCKTTQDRARSIIQELNVARFLNEYSDEHVMTLSEIALAKKLLGFRKLKNAYKGYQMIIVSVDASSWNNRFRHATVAPVAVAVLDKVFAVPIFSKTHEAYEHSFIIMPDVEEVYYWDGQKGGIEGLNQDTWVHVYIQQMKVCVEKHPYPYYILCKGDDLRIAVMIPPAALATTTLDNLKSELLSEISKVGAKFGHVIKVEDSYASECYFAYSKNTFVNDVEQPQALRKVQKCYGANNAFLNVTDDYVGSAFSNAHSTSKTAPSPLPCYATACFWAAETIVTHEIYVKLSDNQLCALLQVPNMLGGFPVIYLHNFFVRAESDLLPPFLDLCQKLLRLKPSVGHELEKFLHQKVASAQKSLGGLFLDGYSLPISKPQQAATILRQEVTKLVQRRTKNKYLRQLFSIIRNKFEHNLLECFETANVYNVKLMSAVYDCTPEAIIRELVRKFESGKSIFEALLMNSGRARTMRTLTRCMRADTAVHLYRMQVMTSRIDGSQLLTPPDWMGRCPYDVAQRMRSSLWDKRIEGITQPPLQHQIVVATPSLFGDNDYVADNHFELWCEPPSSTELAPLFTVGSKEPFVGASTGRGLSKPEARLVANNILTTKVRSLMDLYKWATMVKSVEGRVLISNLPKVIAVLLEAYTGKKVAEIMPFAGQRILTRTTQHHVRVNNFRTSIVPNTLMNVYTRVSGNSRSHKFLEASAEHFMVNFLHVYTYGVSLWALKMWMGEPATQERRMWLTTTDCKKCMCPIVEHPVVMTDISLPDITLPFESHLGEIALQELQVELAAFNPTQYYVPEDVEGGMSLEDAQVGLIQGLMNQMWANRIRIQSMYTGHHMSTSGLTTLQNWSSKGSDVDIMSSDLRGLPMSSIVKDLAFMVFTEVVRRFKAELVSSVAAALGNVPGEELPWFMVLLMIDDCGRFYELQKYVHQAMPHTRHTFMDSVRTYTPIFGTICCDLMGRSSVSPTIAHLSHMGDPTLSKDIKYRLWGIRWALLDRAYGPGLRTLSSITPSVQLDIVESLMVGIIIDDEEMELTPFKKDSTRMIVKIFPEHDDPLEFLTGFVECDMDSVTELGPNGEVIHVERETFTPPEYIEAACTRYGLRQDGLLSLMRNCDGERYKRLRNMFERNVPCNEVTILRTDVVTCINKVRSYATSRRVKRPEDGGMMEEVLPKIKPKGMRKYDISGFRAEQAFSYDPTKGLKQYSLDFEWGSTEFNLRWLHRPVGMGNISMSKAASVLGSLGYRTLPEGLSCACLGDGYGGYSSVCAALVSKGRVVYNTFPNRMGSCPEPITALEAASRTNTTVEYSDIDRGHYDLTLSVTFEMMEKHTHLVGLVTLDAEMKPLVCEDRAKMLNYTSTFFVRRGQQGSVLILKVYIQEFDQWMSILGWLVPMCQRCCVLQCRASALDGEIFIVAQLQEGQPQRPYAVAKMYPPVSDSAKLRRFCDRYIRSLVADEGGCNSLDLRMMHSPLVISLAKVLPLYGWSKLQEVCRVVLPERVFARGQARHDAWLDDTDRLLVCSERQCMDEMRGLLPDQEAHAYDTHRHVLVVCDRYLRIAGFRFVVRLMADRRSYLEVEEYFHGYQDTIMRLPATVGLSHNIPAQLVGPVKVGGTTVDPIRSWKLGVRWGVSAMNISKQI
uniref:RNA-directed RNA polymerase n=1 Tax=Umea virus TaxID=2739775 RepID=A0A859D178_9MONO|nr:RNA-dependent RNA polymerase [Umea virus]